MAKLPSQELDRLRGESLFVYDAVPLPGARVRNVLIVAKPKSISGNSIPNFETITGNPSNWIATDAPTLAIFYYDHRWFVQSGDPVIGYDKADFYTKWNTPGEAVNDAINFFFGDTRRMEAKARELHRNR